jgi:hypothetical protein
MNERRSLARDGGLLVAAFVATLILLVGLAMGVGGRTPAQSAGVGSSAGAGSIIAAPPASAEQSAIAPTGVPADGTPNGSAGGSSGAPSDPVLVGAGDIGDCASSGDEETAKLIEGIAGTVFTAGDNAYPGGTAEQFSQCYNPSWGQFRTRTRPAAGNHDWVTKEASGYLGYFGPAATNGAGQTWYSYDLGQWHVVVLDADCALTGGCEAGSVQGRWLAADLAGSSARCTVAIWHQPRFSSGEHGNDAAVAPFWDALYAAGADLVINGHDHDYERFKPQTPTGQVDAARGIREFVVGTGGTPLRVFDQPKPNSDIRAAVSHGILKLTLHPTGYDWAFISTNGMFSDSGSATCH